MRTITLGTTGIRTPQNAFGALPVQRVERDEAVRLLRAAYDRGMTFFDTARAYTDSEEKLGLAFSGMRDRIYLATKTASTTPDGVRRDLETSLKMLRTDYIDLYQLHWPKRCYKPGDGTGVYEELLRAKKEGLIRHIGMTNHILHVAREAIDSGLYETLQFPFSYLSGEQELELVRLCKEHNMGFIAMKALAGGLITNAQAAFAFMSQYDNVLPIWGIQRRSELEQWLSFMECPPEMTPALEQVIQEDRRQLSGAFCRGCGYCMPCPAGIEINTCARMSLLLRRSPSAGHLSEKSQAMMRKILDCTHCGACMKKCPYGLNTPALLKANYEDYLNVLSGTVSV